MTIEFSGTFIVDKIMEIYQQYEEVRKEFKKENPYGIYVTDDTTWREMNTYAIQQKIESMINTLGDIINNGKYIIDLNCIWRSAKRWYERTNWEYCLKNETCDDLVSLYTTERY